MEFFDVSLDLDGGIEQDWKYGLCGAGIVHDLPREEEFLVIIQQGVSLLDALGPLEEEDESVDIGFDPREQVIVFETVDFFDLDCGGSDLLDQLGEDAGVGFNSAPLIKHFYI